MCMYIHDVLSQGCLVTLCADSSLHLWQLSDDNGESFVEEVACLSAEMRSSYILVTGSSTFLAHTNYV